MALPRAARAEQSQALAQYEQGRSAYAREWSALKAPGEPRRGRAVYERYCLACHGPKGDGRGPAARAPKRRPADLTDAARMRAETDDDIYGDIRGGVDGTGMPDWGRTLSPRQTKDVIAWVRVLQARSAKGKP